MRLSAVLLASAALLGGCAPRRGAPAAAAVPSTEDWSLTVVNHHWLDVSVTVLHDGGRSRLGTVSATGRETYMLPFRMIDAGRTVRFEGNPVGANGNVTTEAITVRGGGHVEWTLESGLERSTVAVW